MSRTSPLVLPDPEALEAALAQALPRFSLVEWVAQAGSTNADLIAHARGDNGRLMRPWLRGTHLQLQGRGRAGRSWQNRAGATLMFSCAYDVFLPMHQLPALSPLAGMAACQGLRTLLRPEVRPQLAAKWPNDLLWRSAKLAGILVESTRAGTARLAPDHHIVIMGIGLNLDDARALSVALDRKVADWATVAQEEALIAPADAAVLVACVATAWYEALNRLSAHGLGDFPERYAEVDALAGQPVDVLDDGRLLQTGIACGVNTAGQLLLRHASGQTAVTLGDVSVRPRAN